MKTGSKRINIGIDKESFKLQYDTYIRNLKYNGEFYLFLSEDSLLYDIIIDIDELQDIFKTISSWDTHCIYLTILDNEDRAEYARSMIHSGFILTKYVPSWGR